MLKIRAHYTYKTAKTKCGESDTGIKCLYSVMMRCGGESDDDFFPPPRAAIIYGVIS